MTVVDTSSDSELVRLLSTIQELSEQLSQNRSLATSLYTTTGTVKTQATHAQTGFVLRRFNLDKTKEAYDAELQRMNASLVSDNQNLQHDNKQLGILIREYEQTLESVMSAFRTRARDVQEHELAFIRDYESKLLKKESENLLRALTTSTSESVSLARMSRALRKLMRLLNGEDALSSASGSPSPDGASSPANEAFEFDEGRKDDRALEQEIELARLQKENIVLRRMLNLQLPESEYRGSGVESIGTVDLHRHLVPRPSSMIQRGEKLGGMRGTVGPYGTYKRRPGQAL
ncbi:hypothetical protein F5J12DRAFT_801154 [Pisolithus orientalis]|uniref:uncharacterized protein n=1 Tax=Pisolithus orientalis TaxID=936130 RepID=UPI002224F3CB|nr:uncharacterized protein F5J12DRAFT_801154 [Pisolithus orientalis]KAI6030537.1 hypothetical protein F5J12DRAFT_801154 [Pisolithus orientalis]